MRKNKFFKDEVTEGFANFLADIASERFLFSHSYITSKPKAKFEFLSMQKSFKGYNWGGEDFKSNSKRLKKLGDKLQESLSNNDEHKCLIACLKILEWGQVYRGSVGWIANKADEGELVKSIKDAHSILTGSDSTNISKFGKKPNELRSDSGMTKIYALSGEGSIIYDDRVGAALAMFAKEYLEYRGINKVPETLKFMCKAKDKSGRNPSTGSLKFPSKDTGENHAKSNLYANWLIEHVAKSKKFNWELDGTSLTTRMHAIEAALFMIGYTVSGNKIIESKVEFIAR